MYRVIKNTVKFPAWHFVFLTGSHSKWGFFVHSS